MYLAGSTVWICFINIYISYTHLGEKALSELRGEDVPRRDQELLARCHGIGRAVLEKVDHARGDLLLVGLHQRGETPKEVRQEAQGFHLLGSGRKVVGVAKEAGQEVAGMMCHYPGRVKQPQREEVQV